MLQGWRNLGPKIAKKTSLPNGLPSSLSFSLSLPPVATATPPMKLTSSSRPARAPLPPRQVTFLSPSASPSSSSPPSCRSACRRTRGGKWSPPFFSRSGRFWPSPDVWAGSGPDQRSREDCWAEISLTLLGWVQPSPHTLWYYVLYIIIFNI